MRTLTIVASCLLLFGFTKCKRREVQGHGKITTESRSLPAFHAVHISAPLNAHIRLVKGGQQSISLKGYETLLPSFTTEVKNGVLTIKVKEDLFINTDKDVEAMLTLPFLEELSISGSSDADITGTSGSETLSLNLSGSSDVTASALNLRKLDLAVSGSSDVRLQSGYVQQTDYSLSGAGNVYAFALRSEIARVAVSGAAEVELQVEKQLDVQISGSGDVRYKGHPQLNSQISGSGTLTAKN